MLGETSCEFPHVSKLILSVGWLIIVVGSTPPEGGGGLITQLSSETIVKIKIHLFYIYQS